MNDYGARLLSLNIVRQAVDDYKQLLRGKRINPERSIEYDMMEIERFLKSDFCYSIIKRDGKIIIERLRKEYEDECKANSANQKPNQNNS